LFYLVVEKFDFCILHNPSVLSGFEFRFEFVFGDELLLKVESDFI